MPSPASLRLQLVAAVLFPVLLIASAAAATGAEPFVRVRKGDSLYRIARHFGTSVERLKTDNRLTSDVIHPGQRLQLPSAAVLDGRAPGAWKASPPLRQLSGNDVIAGFGVSRDQRHTKVVQRHTGLDLRASRGDPILAAGDGIVRFLGSVAGFGTLVIVEHVGGWRTVYCPLDPDRPAVEVNEIVYAGEQLGRLGSPVETDGDALHFEVRRGDEAVDPRRRIDW